MVVAARILALGQYYFADSVVDAAGGMLCEAFSSPRPVPLTSREAESVQAIADGMTSKEIAGRRGISIRTVESHRSSSMKKTRSATLAQLIRWAVRNHLIEA